MPKREIGLSDEAVIARCCNLDETDVWAAPAPKTPLSDIGLVQSDVTLPVMGNDPCALSGLPLTPLYSSGQSLPSLIL